MEVELQRVPFEEKGQLFEMMQKYIAEFSAFEPVDCDANGVYLYEPFDSYWQESERHPFFIMADDRRAGLVLVNRNHYISLYHPSRSIAEFFILPEYRRGGVGTAAARILTESMGGWWQLMMHPKNMPSHIFWQKTFDYPGARYLRVKKGPHWYDGGVRGMVMTFKSVGGNK